MVLHFKIFTESGRVFTFGANDWGQLGIGSTKPATKPTCVKGNVKNLEIKKYSNKYLISQNTNYAIIKTLTCLVLLEVYIYLVSMQSLWNVL